MNFVVKTFTLVNPNLFAFLQYTLVLTNSTKGYDTWIAPPVHPTLKVYLYNYTNIQDGSVHPGSKIRVEEVGPYTYR